MEEVGVVSFMAYYVHTYATRSLGYECQPRIFTEGHLENLLHKKVFRVHLLHHGKVFPLEEINSAITMWPISKGLKT